MISTIDEIKNTVKSHTVIPFTARDISCFTQNKQSTLVVSDRYAAQDNKAIMEALGIRNNLSKDIFAKPDENWNVIRSAINSIDKTKQFAAIVDDKNNIVTLVNSKAKEPAQLNYDNRIDLLFNTIYESPIHNFQNIVFNPQTCDVEVNAITTDEIDCGLGDLWNFGTSTTVGLMNQQFKQFFNRLICTNGMTTKQGVAYRMDSASTNIAKQFLKYSSNRDIVNAIRPRVDKLRNSRASLYEVNAVAKELNKEDRQTFFPSYENMVQDFEERGHVMKDISTKRQRFMYTNENLYDVFNLATNLASHQRDLIGAQASVALNKVAGDMFAKGPLLEFNVLDIYKQ
jgi:hypothetical protein